MAHDTPTITKISFGLPTELRERIRAQAALEERSESGFLRFHLGQLFAMSDEETTLDEEGDAQ